jgi:hypothetical protein
LGIVKGRRGAKSSMMKRRRPINLGNRVTVQKDQDIHERRGK